jgi:hypothetical protein
LKNRTFADKKITEAMTHTIEKYFILLSLLLLCLQGQSQTVVWAKKASAAVSDTKRLIVLQLDSTDLPDVKKYKKRTDLVKLYQSYTRKFNEMIKTPILAHWQLCPKVDFMSMKDFLAFRRTATPKDKKETLVLLFESPEYQFMYALEKLPPAALANLEFEKVVSDDDYIQPISLFNLETVRPFDENEIAAAPSTALARIEVNRWYLNPSDIAFAVENMQTSLLSTANESNQFLFCVNFYNSDKGKLSIKTLLIPEAYTVKMSSGKKTITEADIKENYPWPWRFATNKEIDEAIEKKDATTAVLLSTTNLIANNDGGTYFWAVDAKDARTILGYSNPGNKNLGVATVMKENDLFDLNVRRLREIIETAKGN